MDVREGGYPQARAGEAGEIPTQKFFPIFHSHYSQSLHHINQHQQPPTKNKQQQGGITWLNKKI